MDTLTIAGNLAGNPELRYTADGRAVANFTVCSTPRYFDRSAGEYRDGETLFMVCSIWQGAEHVAESLHRGDRVLVTGRVKSRTYETKDQPPQKRTVLELAADEVGPSLKWATAKVTRATRSSGAAGSDDPWSAAPDSAPVKLAG